MNDIIEKETIEIKIAEKKIRPLEKQSRVALFVYCSSYKGNRQLTRFGDLGYISRKANYSVLYVNESEVEEVTEKLKQLKFVKKVRPSHLKDMNTNFSEAFVETNTALKAELEEID